MNNDAITCLINGDYEGAMKGFAKALERAQWNIANQEEGMVELLEAATSNSDIRKVERSLKSVSLEHLHYESGFKDDGTIALYRCGLWFDLPPHILIAAALIYNTGLCHHMMAMERPAQSSKSLKTALNMYTMAFRYLAENEDEFQKVDDFFILVLAILHNTAHIHGHFTCLDQAWDCLAMVHAIFDNLGEDTLTEEECKFFGFFSMLGEDLPGESFVGSPAA